MLISHEHKLIFLQAEKTGGTSLARALAAAIGPDAVGSVMRRPGWARYSPIHHGALKRQLPQFFGLHTHATARQVRNALGRKSFDSYLKVAVERNPWDRQVSLYTHRAWKKGGGPENFDRDMRSLWYRNTEYCRLNNWSIYAIGDRVVADRVLRYENLAAESAALFADLGLDPVAELPRLRAYAPDRPHYSTYYSPKTRALVGRWYAREIDALGYEFEKQPGASRPDPKNQTAACPA